MGVSEKVAYLKGLMEGMKLDESSDNGKLFKALVDVLDEITLELDGLTDEVGEIGDGLDVVSDDLEDLEKLVYDDEDDDDEEDEDETVYATTCPECEEQIFFDEDYLEDGMIVCPNCGAKLEFDPEDFVEEGEEEKDDD